jgi:hypothetical protein
MIKEKNSGIKINGEYHKQMKFSSESLKQI